jgi:hypothetical protein
MADTKALQKVILQSNENTHIEIGMSQREASHLNQNSSNL